MAQRMCTLTNGLSGPPRLALALGSQCLVCGLGHAGPPGPPPEGLWGPPWDTEFWPRRTDPNITHHHQMLTEHLPGVSRCQGWGWPGGQATNSCLWSRVWDPEERATGCYLERTASKVSSAGWVSFPGSAGNGAVQGDDSSVGRNWGEWSGLSWGEGQLAMRPLSIRSCQGLLGCTVPYRGVPRASARWTTGAAGRRPGGVSCPWGWDQEKTIWAAWG